MSYPYHALMDSFKQSAMQDGCRVLISCDQGFMTINRYTGAYELYRPEIHDDLAEYCNKRESEGWRVNRKWVSK